MDSLQTKKDFVIYVVVIMCNPNGGIDNGGAPRNDYDGYGIISDVCIKRKLRNRMQDLGYDIFVKSEGRQDDGFLCLRDRAKQLESFGNSDEFARQACGKWLDVRSFGQLFAFKDDKDKGGKGISKGIRGPVSVQIGMSVDPVEIVTMDITKSTNSESSDGKRDSDTIGKKSFVRFGLYRIAGSINTQLSESTGFGEQDAEVIKKCLQSLFDNDASAARPEGSMEVVKMYWFDHGCKDGRYPSGKVQRSVTAKLKDGVDVPRSINDYEFSVTPLEGVKMEEYSSI